MSAYSARMRPPQEGSDDLPGIMPRAFEYMVAQVAANSGEAGRAEGPGLITPFGGPGETPDSGSWVTSVPHTHMGGAPCIT